MTDIASNLKELGYGFQRPSQSTDEPHRGDCWNRMLRAQCLVLDLLSGVSR